MKAEDKKKEEEKDQCGTLECFEEERWIANLRLRVFVYLGKNDCLLDKCIFRYRQFLEMLRYVYMYIKADAFYVRWEYKSISVMKKSCFSINACYRGDSIIFFFPFERVLHIGVRNHVEMYHHFYFSIIAQSSKLYHNRIVIIIQLEHPLKIFIWSDTI